MVKMHNLRRTAADVKAEKSALGEKRGKGKSETGDMSVYVPPEDEGARFELEHHHLTKMGLGGDLKSGDTVHFHGHGTVEKSETRSSPDGDRHSATVRFHHGGVEHEARDRDGDARADLRNEIAKAAADKEIKEPKGGKY